MQVSITATHNTPDDEFQDLCKVYPLGKYTYSNGIAWFRLKIDTDKGQIEIIWFREQIGGQ